MEKPGLRDALPQPQQSDTRNDPFWGNLDSSLSAAEAAPPQSAQPAAKRDLDVGLGDVARGVGAGALELVGGIGELARQASNFGRENAGKQGGDYLEQARANMANKLSPVLDAVAGAGDLAQGGAESLTEGMSADAKEALGRRLVDETPEGRLTLGDGAGDIDVWAMKMAQGVGSLLPTLAAGGVTGVAAKASIGRAVTASMVKRGATQEVAEAVAAKAVSNIATGAAVTTGATGSVGSAGVNTRDTVLGMSFDELAGSDTFRQSFTRIDQDQQTAHLSDEEKLGLAREETANLASRATMSDAKVWGAAAMGSMMGDAMLFKMLAGKAATGGVLKGAAKGAAGEGISETLEEGVQQYAVNESLNEVAAADIDPMKGVMSSAIEGGLIGMGTGGAVGAVGGARGGKHASQEDGVGTDPVAEPSAPVTEGAAGPAVDPNFASVPLEDGEQAPSASQAEGELNPLGPSASQFDELRDVPAYLRRDDTAARFKGMAADSEVQRALAGEFGQSVQELVASQMQAGDQGKSLYERAQAGELGLDPFAGNKSAQQVAMENQRTALPLKDVIFAGDANAARGMTKEGHFDDKQAGTGPQFRGAERTRWQSGQEGDVLPPEASSTKPAGELPGAVIEGEASEVGNELPHRNVVYGNDLRAEQQRAADLARRERELNNQPLKIGQSETLFAGGTPGADPRNSAYTPPKLSRDQVDTSMGEQSTRDPRSPVAQSIEQAGSATDSVFGPLQTLRITRKGKPFATEKEAAMASRKGQEMPVPLNGGGFGVAAIGEVQQAQAQQGAVKQPSSNSAQQDRQDGKTEIAQNGMVIVHGSGNPGMSEQDIQIVRASGQKQGKKGRVYGGFYGTSEQDAHQAQAYADMMGGTPTLYDVKIKPGTKVLHKQGDITRLSESYINELVSQGYGVVTGTDPRGQTEHVVIDKSAVASMAPRGAQATPSQVDDINVADMRQPSDQPAKNVSADTVPAPSATAGEASQLVPAIDTGYREVIPGNQPQAEVSNEPVTPIPAISSERSGDQPGAGDPVATSVGPTPAELAERAGPGDPADGTSLAPVPVTQPGEENSLTAPAPAGVAVSEEAQAEQARTTAGPAAAATPWSEMIDNPDGTITLKGEVPIIKQWAKDNGVKAIPGKGGLVVSTTSVAKVRQHTTSVTSEPVRQIEAARAEVAPEPTEAQKEAGNYKKGHLTLLGLDIALENPKGSTRSGTDQDGRPWQSTMAHDYGYIKRTQGADGDHVDVFIGDKPESEMVYVVDQVDPKTGKFDEHKVMMGFADEQAARAGYLGNYEEGWQGLGAIKAMPVDAFKRWVKGGDTRSPIAAQPVAGTVNSVRFSKQAMAQGDKPIKHLTRKEAELVSRGWFKQYRGASGIKVQIHATQGELEGALGLEAKEGLIRRAAFDDDAGTLHVAADTISDPKRMREILRHEVLAHYGLANVLGDGEYTKLMSRLIQSQKDPSMKPVWDWVNTHYADEDIGTQAEEVVAHLAELEQGAWGRGWDRVVAWVTRALRTVGFVPDGITAPETRSLIEGLGKKLRKADAEVGSAEGERLWFSAERSPWGKDFPEVILHGRLADATSHPDYAAAKGGDDAAARRLVSDVLSPDAIRQLKKVIGNREAIALGVHAEEAVSRNAIPSAMADILGKVLGIEVDLDIMQSAKVGRTAQDGFGRLANQPGFDGPVRNDKPYLIMDDTLTQGGTLANLKGYIENRGGEVLAATALTGKQYSAKIAIDSSTLEQLRDQYDGTGLEAWWHNRFGYGFDSLTESEGRYLLRAKDADKVRDRVAAAGPQAPSRSEQESARDDGPFPPDGLKFSQTNSAADEALQKLNLGPKPDIIDKTKASLSKLRQVDRGVVSSWIDRVIKKANTEVLDALAPIKYAEDAAGITDAADSGYVAARMATGAASTMQATMLYGLPEWKDGVIQRKAGTGEKDALLGIFADLGADLHNWLGWMAGHRAELLLAQGRENLLDAQDIAALKAQGKGKEAKFHDAKARWNRLNAATLDLAQEAGLFTKEARAEFESEWYIPFFRESDDGDVIAPFKPKGIANQNAGIKKLKGGEANTNDLLENIFTSTSKLIDASMKNMAAQKTVWNLADTGIIEVIPKPNKMDYQALANGKDRIMVKLEGEDYMIRVEDPDLYRAMTFFDRKPFSAMVNVAAKAKRLLTAGVTASPEFMLRNFLRDSLSSWAISKDGFRPVIDSIKGVKKTLAMDGSTIDVMFSGASFLGGYVNGNDPEAMADTVRKSLRRKGMTPEQIARYEKSIIRNAAQAKGVVANVWEKYNRYGEAFENANREAVYAAAIKAGKSHAQAAFESKDLMDFSMLGASRTMQVMTQLLPFFNARVQGLGKLTRELRDNPRAIAKRAGMITAASLALLAANWDDERYEELPDWDKDANWHFFVGDQHFRIPKPFEIGVLFGTIPERMVRALGGKDTGAQFGKAVARAIGDTFALNPTPQLVKPMVEAAFNYDSFRGGPIDGPQDLNVQAEARYNEQTSLLMRELGELAGFSPKQLEHLVIGYTGTMGSYVMAAADGLIRAARPGESASWRADEIPLVKAVYRGTGPAKSTQHMEEFYRMLNEVNQLKRTVDQYRSEGLTDKASELLEEQGGILKSRRSLSRTQQQVRVVRNKIELIQRDRTLAAEEKRRRIDEMLARRNDLVYQAVNKNKANWE